MNTSIHATPAANADQSRTNAASTSASGTTSPSNAVPAQPTAKSYASATKKQGPPVVASSAPQVAVGGSQPSQHGAANSISPVNGTRSIPPAVPSVGPAIANSSAIANGATSAPGHDRKSSVTITSSQGYLPNGGAAGNPNRASITFGSVEAGGSPAMANSVPHSAQNSSLPTPPTNPRVTSPSHSPSPIPTPAPSGGRPPSSLQKQPIPLSFGSTAGDGSDQNMRAVSMPQGPSGLTPQSQHLRRESSQSSHSDMSATPGNRPYPPGSGRGRGFQPNFPGAPMANSPQPQYRQAFPPQHRPGQMQYQPQSPGMRTVSAPYQGNRSPAVNPAQLHQPHMGNGMQMGGYSPYMQQNPMYPMGQQFDPHFAAYYGQPQMYPHMGNYGAPPSPRPPQFNSPHGPQAPYMQGAYSGQGQVPPMARTPSQGPERPPSALNPPSTPSLQSASVPPTNQGSASPAPSASSNFTIPPKPKSKAIRITNADGVEIDLSKTAKAAAPSPAPAASSQAQPPPVVTSTPTPPPKSATPQQAPKDVQPSESAEEKRKKFLADFQKQLEGENAKSEPVEEAAKAAEKAVAAAPAIEPKATKEVKEEAAPKKEDVPPPTTAAEPPQAAPVDEDEEMERMIREMEEEEKKREEAEKQFRAKREQEKAEQAKREAAAKANEDEELKRQEREAEERELAREKAREQGTAESSDDAKAKADFAALKKPTLGPGATSAEDSSPSTPEPAAAAAEREDQPTAMKAPAGKPKPTALKLETNKAVEPAQPTAGMQSLKSARFLAVSQETKYPEGVASPNPSLNVSSKGNGRQYDKNFLLQFQEVFKEKPSVDWDQKIKDTIGDGSESARPQSARTSSNVGPRQPSRGGISAGGMGNFGNAPSGARPIGPGSTSAERFAASNNPGMGIPAFGNFGRPGAGFPGPGMVRNPSQTNFQPARGLGPDSPRVGSSRGRGSKRPNAREEAEKAAKMPLTAGMDLKPLEPSSSGWKATSLGPGAAAAAPTPGGRLTPDLVQRKVKAALNKMTPEKFDKIADDILAIAAQSKDETDGRTLRQVIQLTFEKACDEAHWASMYAKFANRMLTTMSTDIKDEDVKDKHGQPVVGGALFRKYLLNRCQEEFERGWEVNLPDKPEGESQEAVILSDEYYVAAAAKRRGLGLIQFIGELFKLSMLTIRIMHECVMKLLNFEGVPDEAAIESLTKLLRTIGATMDGQDQGRHMMEVYFERINKIIDMPALNSRLRFMLMDVRDLRKSGWKDKGDKGPKTIQEIHAEAAQAQAQAELERARSNVGRGGGRPPVGRGDVRSFSGGMPPPEYNRNQVNMADLKNLSRGAASRNTGPSNLGPASLLSGSRSNSGRKGLGPGSARPGEESGLSSRTGTPPAEKKEPSTSANAFSALAGLDAEGDDAASQPANSPQPTNATPAIANDLDARAREGDDATKP